MLTYNTYILVFYHFLYNFCTLSAFCNAIFVRKLFVGNYIVRDVVVVYEGVMYMYFCQLHVGRIYVCM